MGQVPEICSFNVLSKTKLRHLHDLPKNCLLTIVKCIYVKKMIWMHLWHKLPNLHLSILHFKPAHDAQLGFCKFEETQNAVTAVSSNSSFWHTKNCRIHNFPQQPQKILQMALIPNSSQIYSLCFKSCIHSQCRLYQRNWKQIQHLCI